MSKNLISILEHSLKVSKLDLDIYSSFGGNILFFIFRYSRIIYIFLMHKKCPNYICIHYTHIIVAFSILQNTYNIIAVKGISYNNIIVFYLKYFWIVYYVVTYKKYYYLFYFIQFTDISPIYTIEL